MITRKTLPRGFVVRHPTMNDIESTLRMIQAHEMAMDGEIETTLEDMHRWWNMPDFDIATDAWLLLSPEGHIAGTAALSHRAHARLNAEMTLHPAFEQPALGAYLLSLVEERALQHIPLAPSDARVAILAWTSSGDKSNQELLLEHGFKHIRASWRMKIELQEAPPAPHWPEGIHVQTLSANMNLLRAVYEADEEAFRDHWGHMPHTFEEFQYFTSRRKNYDPSLWFLAMDGEQIAGIALCADEKEQGGWVHSLAVRRPWRRRGIGEALLYHAFGEFYRRGINSVYLGVDAQSLTGATRLYQRVGMHIHREYHTYEKELRAGRELSTQSLDGE